ncbi:hypothetical protein Gotur_025789 [Gossypium turneri]
MELRASLDKIVQMKKKVEELEMALQNCEIRLNPLKPTKSVKKNNSFIVRTKSEIEIILWGRL